MTTSGIWILLLGIGFVAGLRTFTAPAAVAWGAHLGWLHLAGTRLSFLASIIAVAIFTLGALGEFVGDQLPSTPARTVPAQLGARLAMGAFSGAALALAARQSVLLGIIVAMVGALAGTFAGYHARRGLVRGLKVPDFVVAIPEDLIAVGLGFLVVSRF